MQAGFSNEVLFISSKKQLNKAENKEKKLQISRMEKGVVSHCTWASHKQGCIALFKLRRCDAYWLTVTDSSMGQGAQLKWVLVQIYSCIQ